MANDAQSRKKPGNRPKKTIRSIDKMPESEPSQASSSQGASPAPDLGPAGTANSSNLQGPLPTHSADPQDGFSTAASSGAGGSSTTADARVHRVETQLEALGSSISNLSSQMQGLQVSAVTAATACNAMQQRATEHDGASIELLQADLEWSKTKTRNHVYNQKLINEGVREKLDELQDSVKASDAHIDRREKRIDDAIKASNAQTARLEKRIAQLDEDGAATADRLKQYIHDNEIRAGHQDRDFVAFNNRIAQIEHDDLPALDRRLRNVEGRLSSVQNQVAMVCQVLGLDPHGYHAAGNNVYGAPPGRY